MKTSEYLWWVATIRQEDYKSSFPLTIIAWVSFTIGLISFAVFFISDIEIKITIIFFKLGFICMFIMIVSTILEIIRTRIADKEIKTVKRLWEGSSINETDKQYPKELKWYFADYIKTE